MNLHYIVISDEADQTTIDAAIIALTGKKTRACIPSTKDEIQADIDQLLERRSALSATA